MFHVLQKDFIFPWVYFLQFYIDFHSGYHSKELFYSYENQLEPSETSKLYPEFRIKLNIQHLTCLSSLESVFWGIPCWSSFLEHGVFTAGAQVPFLVRELRSFKLGVMVKESGLRWGMFLTCSSMFIRKMGLPRWHQW